MVFKSEKGHDVVYKCEDCGFSYEKSDDAQECEAWCKKHGNCNMDITARSVERRAK